MKKKIFFTLLPFLFCVVLSLFPWKEGNKIELSQAKMPPNLEHYFGTDLLGRDIFQRILDSFKISLSVGIGASSLALIFALCFVFFSQLYFPFWGQRIIEIFLALPSLLFVMFVQSMTAGNLWIMTSVIALGHWAVIAKVLQNEVFRLCKQDFYLNALVLGASKKRALLCDIFPACFNLLFVLWVLNIAHAIGNEATLSFFGLGIEPTQASLGNMLAHSSKAIFIGGWWMILFPLLAMMCLILPLLSCANLLQNIWGINR